MQGHTFKGASWFMRVSTKLDLRGGAGLSQTGLDKLDFLCLNRSRTLRTPQAHSQTQRHACNNSLFPLPLHVNTFVPENERNIRCRSEEYWQEVSKQFKKIPLRLCLFMHNIIRCWDQSLTILINISSQILDKDIGLLSINSQSRVSQIETIPWLRIRNLQIRQYLLVWKRAIFQERP